ncbi:MAG: ArnT family glycosyltransferase [Chloroflexota bacterium]
MTKPAALAARWLAGATPRPLEGVRRVSRGLEAALLLLLLLGSGWLRLYRLGSVPPGMFIDEATNGLDIRNVLAGHFMVFFPRNYGREALFIYFQALLVAGGGARPIVFTYSAVVMGMLTIAISYRLLRALFGWRVGLIAAALLSTSLWFVDLSRFGLRTVALPPLLCISLYCLWRTLRTGRRSYAIYSGLALGLALYTYISSRLAPFLVVLIWLAEWPAARRHWRELVLLVLVAVAVFAPEGVYFWQHRQELALRAGAVSVFNPNPNVEGSHDTPIESVLNTAGMFFVRGDENQRHNIPHRPVFAPWLAAFFAAGLVMAAARARRQRPYRWALLWLAVMCLPSALSHESPSSFRALAVAPVTFVFPALAFEWLMVRWRAWRAGELLACAAVFASAGMTVHLYFGVWAHDLKTYWAYDGNLPKVAAFLKQRPPEQTYFAVDHRSTIEFLDPASQQGRWYREESAAIPIPAGPENVLYLSAPTAQLKNIAQAELPGLQPVPHSTDPAGGPDFYAYRWPASSAASLLHAMLPLGASLAPDFRLQGWELVRGAGGPALDLFWRPLRASGPYDLYVHLLDASGKQVAQSDRLVWPVDEGPAQADLLLTQHPFSVPPGSYTAEIGAVHRSAANRDILLGQPIGGVVRLKLTIRRMIS